MKHIRGFLFLLLSLALLASFAAAFSGQGSGTVSNPYNISSCLLLNETRLDLTANYQLTSDIDCGIAPWNNESGWEPIGNLTQYFNGTFYGNNYRISNIYINRSLENYTGLFGHIRYLTAPQRLPFIVNLTLTNFSIKGDSYVGGLVGHLSASGGCTLNSIRITGVIKGYKGVGGLVGSNKEGPAVSCTLINVESLTNVSGFQYVGGILGGFQAKSFGFYNSSFNGILNGSSQVGGIVGESSETIDSCYSSGTIYGNADYVGGIVGNQAGGSVTNSYTNMTIYGGNYVGGIIGYTLGTGSSYSYSMGFINGSSRVGGIIGYIGNQGHYLFFSIARVNGTSYVGGIDGEKGTNNPTGSHWLNYTDDSATDCYSGGNTDCTAETDINYFKNRNNEPLSSLDFVSKWRISPMINGGFPFLRWQKFNASYSNFPGSTDFNSLPDITKVDNAKISNSQGSIEWLRTVSMSGSDINNDVVIGSGFVSLNMTNMDSSLNSTAKLTVTIPGCKDVQMYHTNVHVTDESGWLANRAICNLTTTPKCEMINCSGNTLVFNITYLDGGGGDGNPIAVPEFSTITTILALAIVLSGFLFLRKQRL